MLLKHFLILIILVSLKKCSYSKFIIMNVKLTIVDIPIRLPKKSYLYERFFYTDEKCYKYLFN